MKYLSSNVKNTLRFLLHSQYWTLSRLKAYQWRKLTNLIHYAWRNVPYYKNLFATTGLTPKDIKCFDDISRIPILTKEDIKKNVSKLIAQNISNSNLLTNYTGGSTGHPIKFFQDQNYLIWADAARIRHWKYFPGFDETVNEAVLWGADRDIAYTLRPKQILKILVKRRGLSLNTFNTTDFSFLKFVLLFNYVKPPLLRGYASSLVYLADFVQRKKIPIHSPQRVISSAEALHPNERTKIEKNLNTLVLDSYGCREVSQIAMECDYQNGYHVVMENQYVEIVDGKIVVTNLNNLAMPFIRYEIGDLADEIIEEPCECGRGLVRIAHLKGRESDNLYFGGKVIHAEYITHLFYRDTPITRFQIVKNEEKNRLRVLVDKEDERIRHLVLQSLRQKFPEVFIDFQVTNDFIKTSTGKIKMVVDESDKSITVA